MKRLAIALSLVATLALCAAALAAGGLSGSYTTKIGSKPLGGQLKGTWTITFKNGKYSVAENGTTLVHGKYTISNGKITFGHETGQISCKPSGVYSFKLTGKKLKFTRVSDSSSSCEGRAAVLAGNFTKSG